MSKKLESKLADSVRHAKQQNDTAADTKSAASKSAAPKSAQSGKFAAQDDQAPKSSLDNPWDNLYPDRIWPD